MTEQTSTDAQFAAIIAAAGLDEAQPCSGLQRQGDILIRPVRAAAAGPAATTGVVAITRDGNRHHLEPQGPIGWAPRQARTGVLGMLEVPAGSWVRVTHEGHHLELQVAPGTYEVIRQREYVPPGPRPAPPAPQAGRQRRAERYHLLPRAIRRRLPSKDAPAGYFNGEPIWEVAICD